MARNPVFEEDSIGDYRYDNVEDFYSAFPLGSAPGQVNMDQNRVNPGNFFYPQYYGHQDVQQPIPEAEPYLDTGLQYSQAWGPVGSSRHTYQWSEFEAPRAMDRSFYEHHHQRELGGGPASPFLHQSIHLPYAGFVGPQDHDDTGNYGPPQNIKRPRSEVDGDDSEKHFESPLDVPASKRQKRRSGTDPHNAEPTRSSQQPRPTKKLKAIARPARKDRIQGTKGAEHNPKGMIRTNAEGQLEWRETEELDWGAAGYHNDHRAELIALDEVEGESYDEQPAGGGDSDSLNVTSYCSLQRHWTADKASVLDGQHRQILHMLDAPDDWVHNPKVTPMKHRGMTMLDQDGFPVRGFTGIPRVLSTHIEPFRLEGLRRCTGMTIPDFRARMPFHRIKGSIIASLQTPQAFTNRMNHWRVVENVGAWLERDGSQNIKDYIKDQLPDPELKTTESLSALNSAQRKKVYGLNKGRYLNKSRYEHPPRDTSATPSEGHRQSTGTGVPRKRDRRGGAGIRNESGSRLVKEEQNMDVSANAAGPLRTHNPSRPNSVPSSTAVAPQATKPDDGVDDAVDYRFWPPSTAIQATSVQAALYYTRADYAYRLREEAPTTPVFESYISQYLQLQEQLSSRWDPARGEVPTLMGLGIWVGGWNMWQQPDATEEEFSLLLPRA